MMLEVVTMKRGDRVIFQLILFIRYPASALGSIVQICFL